MKNRIFTIFCFSMLVLFLASASFAQESALKVAGFEGKVQVKLAAAADWIDAVVDQPLNPNDAIRTGADGQAMLQFSDKSTVALKPSTEIIVEELVWNETARKAGFNMPAGEMRAVLKKIDTPSDFKVKTPTAICGARGTVFYLLVTPTETRVFVMEGAVDFTNPASGNTYVVVQSMSAISDLGGGVTEPRELTGDEKDQALAGWSGVIAETYTEPPDEYSPGGDDMFRTDPLDPTPENPGDENQGQNESEASPI